MSEQAEENEERLHAKKTMTPKPLLGEGRSVTLLKTKVTLHVGGAYE
jgi:hypothetical protein